MAASAAIILRLATDGTAMVTSKLSITGMD